LLIDLSVREAISVRKAMECCGIGDEDDRLRMTSLPDIRYFYFSYHTPAYPGHRQDMQIADMIRAC
jgi:hypothetical protein